MDKVTINFSPQAVKGVFAKHTSNVGFPWFAKETTNVGGKTYRELSVDFTKYLNTKYGS